MPRLKVLLTVTTYPLPSRSYDELVCTAGILEDGSWIRIYPMPLSFLRKQKISGKLPINKYTWIELDLRRRYDSDFRPESYSPVDYEFRDLQILEHLKPTNFWAKRKEYCLKNVYTNLTQLLDESKAPTNRSLATFKPTKIIDFIIEQDEREWKEKWKAQFVQYQMNFDNPEDTIIRSIPDKMPYRFSYRFVDDAGRESILMIEDWEIVQLYWNSLRSSETKNEKEACQQVKKKYFDTFTAKNDIYLFLGSQRTMHIQRARNPFVIIGVFYPLRDDKNKDQLSLW
ncbi:MAG: hypothetical protein RIS29_2615 [Bacteroidota bacterium]|jgi:hypothetical protein